MTWYSDDLPPKHKITASGWARVILRGTALGTLTFGCLILLLTVRLIERPIFGQHRPMTPFITQFVCRGAFVVMGLELRHTGSPMEGAGAVVANHSSWLDIFALNAAMRIYFVSKADVAKWPGIGWLARATGTIFISRDRRKAAEHVDLFRERLSMGHKLLFFPEGTSTDGLRVLPFKPTLFAAFFDPALRETLSIQAVSVLYSAPDRGDVRHYGWWGDMDFGSHFLAILAQHPQGRVTVIYHDPVRVADFEGRKALAAHLESIVRDGHSAHSGGEFS